MQSCLDSVAKEYPDFSSDILDSLTRKVNNIATHLGTFIQVVNDFDKTIERIIFLIAGSTSLVELPTEGPWIQRAREIKATKQIDNDLDHKFHLAQSEIKDLILQLKLKEKSLEETHVKIKLLDSRMGNVKKQSDRISALEKQISEAKARETQFEEAIENLNGDLRNAESEVGKWRKAAKEGKVGGIPTQNEKMENIAGGPRVEEVRLAEQVETLQVHCSICDKRIREFNFVGLWRQIRGLMIHSFRRQGIDTPQAIVEGKRMALLSDFRKFASACQIVSVKEVEIGGRGWKSTKTTAGFVVRKQQETYRRLCVRKDHLMKSTTSLECTSTCSRIYSTNDILKMSYPITPIRPPSPFLLLGTNCSIFQFTPLNPPTFPYPLLQPQLLLLQRPSSTPHPIVSSVLSTHLPQNQVQSNLLFPSK